MPAIGRRSTKPLNDPPRRTGATATLFQSRKSSCPPLSSSLASQSVLPPPRAFTPIPDAKLPHFSVLTAGRCIATIARMVMQSRVASDVSYIPPPSRQSISRSPDSDVASEFLWGSAREQLAAILRNCNESLHHGLCSQMILSLCLLSRLLSGSQLMRRR